MFLVECLPQLNRKSSNCTTSTITFSTSYLKNNTVMCLLTDILRLHYTFRKKGTPYFSYIFSKVFHLYNFWQKSQLSFNRAAWLTMPSMLSYETKLCKITTVKCNAIYIQPISTQRQQNMCQGTHNQVIIHGVYGVGWKILTTTSSHNSKNLF